MGFFIHDLHRQIQRLHQQQVHGYDRKPLTLYWGQGLIIGDFNKLEETLGGLMSFNNFLSTSTDHEISQMCADSAIQQADTVGKVFIMTIDPSITSTPFANIAAESHFEDEMEILFSMHSVFRIMRLTPIDEKNRSFEVELTLTPDDDRQLCILTEQFDPEVDDIIPSERIGRLLFQTGALNKSEQVYSNPRGESTNDDNIARCCRQLGTIMSNKGDNKRASTVPLWKSSEYPRENSPCQSF